VKDPKAKQWLKRADGLAVRLAGAAYLESVIPAKAGIHRVAGCVAGIKHAVAKPLYGPQPALG
jgi:hypothetical protein